jgi:hypothetical protein
MKIDQFTYKRSGKERIAAAFVIFSLLLPGLLQAQTTREEFLSNIQHAGGVLQSYIFVKTPLTPPPAGYEPCYISHYGRHGSRWLTSANTYNRPAEILREAAQAGKLTNLGTTVYERIKIIAADADKRYGDLSNLGVIEHKAIAERMYHAYPEVFSTKNGRACTIYSRSTTVPRCIISMAANNERLKELDPKITIIREATNRNSYLNTAYKTAGKDSIEALYLDFMNRHFNTKLFLSTLISDTLYVREHIRKPAEFVLDLFEIAGDLQDLDHLSLSLYDIFSQDDIFTLWQTFNIERYSDFTSKEAKVSASYILENILDCAERALEEGYPSADLRFGHDSYISPLLALMNVNLLYDQKPDPESIYKVWSDFKVTPMATSLQLIFYRNSQTGDVLVKLLHCEKEAKIPVPSEIAPYYHWKDFAAYYRQLIGRR